MKTNCEKKKLSRIKRGGFALIMVVFTAGLGVMVMSSAMNWTSSSSKMVDRNNQLNKCILAAEAATEKILSQAVKDYKTGGEGVVYGSLSSYKSMVPTQSEFAGASEFEFNNAQGVVGQTYAQRITSEQYLPLDSQYEGLHGFASNYRVVSNVKMKNSDFNITAAVQQDFQVASIPVFQFAIFYSGLLEFTWAAPLYIRGRVHSNQQIYTGSSAPLEFYDDVTSVGINQKMPWW